MRENDQIRLSKTSNCGDDLQSNLNNYSVVATEEHDTFVVDVEVNEIAANVSICLWPTGGSGYHDTGRRIDVKATRIETVNYHRVLNNISTEFVFSGLGLGSFLQIKVVQQQDGCGNGNVVGGGEVRNVSVGVPSSTEEGIARFQLVSSDVNGMECYMCIRREETQGKSAGGTWRLLQHAWKPGLELYACFLQYCWLSSSNPFPITPVFC